jgi:hypothetical protein
LDDSVEPRKALPTQFIGKFGFVGVFKRARLIGQLSEHLKRGAMIKEFQKLVAKLNMQRPCPFGRQGGVASGVFL